MRIGRMIRKSDGKAGIYLLFLVLGIAFGLISGGEIMRRILAAQASKTEIGVQAQKTAQVVSLEKENPGNDLLLSRQNAIIAATRRVAPCVVGIVVTQIQVVRTPYYGDDFFDFFFGPEMTPRYRQVESIGSGFVISEDGMILTNFHVVQNAAKLFVNFPDGRRLEGKVVGFDDIRDLAVVSVTGVKFKCVNFGNSDEAMIGEWAIAIGNPFLNFINDVHPTVTVGVVSALNRNFAPSEGIYYQGMIQTDAAINPGNSGGPLINALGEVIGINTFIFTGSNNSKGSIGIGFAIPINRARRVAEELIKYGHSRKLWTGLNVKDLNRSIALALGYQGIDGVVVVSVQPGGPADEAGLKPGDIIKRMGNRMIQSGSDIDGIFIDNFVGDRVKISGVRKGNPFETSLLLREAKE